MKNRIVFILGCILFISNGGFSQIRLPKLISDGAILQRDTDLKIWGWAEANETVELNFNNKIYSAKADGKGNWQLMLPPQKAGGPFEFVFNASNQIIVKNVLFGDVWVCSGQSNMELPMERLKDVYPEIIKNSKNNNIRQFLVPDKYDFNQEFKDVASDGWKEANPTNLLQFSGVAYFFAKELYDTYKVPVGLINTALGGSPVESWLSEDALKNFPESYEELEKFKDDAYAAEIEKSDQKRQQDWYAELNKRDKGLLPESEWFLKAINDQNWEEMKVPGFWANEDVGNVNGVVWFRKKINIPKNMVGKKASLWLGRIVDQDHVYVNGKYVGTTGYQYPPRKYTVSNDILKEGENNITIRVINEQGRGGFILDKPYFLAIENDTIDLKGNWKYKLGVFMNYLPRPTFIRWKPTGLYNAMIAPLLNFKIKGVIWYQGESNTSNPTQYFTAFPAMIQNWRDKWRIGDFPFLYVQLANYMEEVEAPTESNWALLRQAQLETLKVSNTGMAVITDLGEWNDIHPLNKQDVGKRLAQEAFKLGYGETKVSLSPIPRNYKFSKKKVKIAFDYADAGLISKDKKPLRYFELSNDGIHFFKASAVIKGKHVIVWNSEIENPKIVRYAWANNPVKANLFSKEGLPVSPFQIKK